MAGILAFLTGVFKYMTEIRWLIGLLEIAPEDRRKNLREAMKAELEHFQSKAGRPKW
jgi:hypothetical protein